MTNHPNRSPMQKKARNLADKLSERLAMTKPVSGDDEPSNRRYAQWRMDCKSVANVLAFEIDIDRSTFLDLCGVPALEQ